MLYPDKRIPVLKNELSNYGKPGKKFKCMLLSKRSQYEKEKYCAVPKTLSSLYSWVLHQWIWRTSLRDLSINRF
jgi:hypothetical protein